jgi:hypothetical protein
MSLPLQHTPHASRSSETVHPALATDELVIVGMKVWVGVTYVALSTATKTGEEIRHSIGTGIVLKC